MSYITKQTVSQESASDPIYQGNKQYHKLGVIAEVGVWVSVDREQVAPE